jgi:hypothetical protein
MSQYLMSCDCGAKTPVSRSQAGMSLPCAGCGKSLDVPTIRNMSSLAVSVDSVGKDKNKIGGRPSIILGLFAALALSIGISTLSYGLYLAWDQYQWTSSLTSQKIDLSRTEEDFIEDVRTVRLQASPADTWDFWNILLEEGLSEPDPPDFFKAKRFIESRKPWISGSLTIASVSLAIFAALAFLMQRTKRS